MSMQRGISRRVLLAGLMAGVATPVWAETPARSPLPRRRGDGGTTRRIPKDPASLVDAAKLGGTVGLVVADAVSGEVLEAHNGDLAQPPASVLKSVTTLFALDRLGIRHQFSTRVLATGPVAGGKILGDLILVGGADPSLDTDMLGDLVTALAAKGVRGITGRYLVYGQALPVIERIDAEQPEFVGYNPAIGGLNLNYNRVHFEWRRGGQGYNITMDARAERFLPQVRMARMKIENRERPLFTYQGGDGVEDWTVASAALGKGGARWMPVRHPSVYVAEVFQTLCAAQGITLPGAEQISTLPPGETVVEHQSAILGEVLRDMLKYSTNLTAEVVGLTASRAPTLPASGAAMTAWAQQSLGLNARFVDHSGLGGGSRISAADMVRALVAAQSGALPGLLKEIGVQDADGRVVKGHPVRVIAKTGTLNFVSGLAGYILPPNGRRLAFAIFSADVARRDALSLSEREQPPGGKAWITRARKLQGALVRHWVDSFV